MSKPFAELAEVFEKLEKTSSHNTMKEILSRLFEKISKENIGKVAYLSLGMIASDYADVNMGMAAKMVVKAIAEAAGKKEPEVTETYKKKGDIGATAEEYVSRRKGKLTIKEVFETFHKIAEATGAGSQEKKIKLLAGLLKKASPKEARYISRITIGNLRLGVGDKTVLDALNSAFAGGKEAKKELEHAYNTCPDVGIIASTIAKKGIKGIKNIGVEIGRPIQSMLCQRVKTLEEVKSRIGYPVVVEEKYDGERVQVHKDGNKIKLYSRRLEDITAQFPDIIEAVKKSVKAKKCVLDSEVMPVDEKGNLLPFQKLMQRRRKHDVEEYVKKVPVVLYVFDMLYLNGKSLIKEKYEKRYSLLQKNLKETAKVKLALHKQCKDADCIEEIFQKTLEHGGEGVVIKNLQGPYEAGVRGWNWVKWKPEYVKDLRDTFDLVVVGAYHGRGRRAGSYGALLCAAYNKQKDRFETFCKLGSGFTDKTLNEMPKKFRKYESKNKPARVEATTAMKPDKWFKPEVVVEVIGAEITKSPNHTCGKQKDQGLALRFPRFNKWRPDKKPEQATTTKEILKMAK